MSVTALAERNGSVPHTPQPWLQKTVQDFFAAINWDDHPPEVQEIKQVVSETQDMSLSLTLSVKQFFESIPWDGKAVAAPIVDEPLAEPPPAGGESFTLDDFSGMF